MLFRKIFTRKYSIINPLSPSLKSVMLFMYHPLEDCKSAVALHQWPVCCRRIILPQQPLIARSQDSNPAKQFHQAHIGLHVRPAHPATRHHQPASAAGHAGHSTQQIFLGDTNIFKYLNFFISCDLCMLRYQGIFTTMGPLTRATGELVNKLSGHQGSLTLSRYLPYP